MARGEWTLPYMIAAIPDDALAGFQKFNKETEPRELFIHPDILNKMDADEREKVLKIMGK